MSGGERILTKAALMHKSRPAVEVVVHESRKKKEKLVATEKHDQLEEKKIRNQSTDSSTEINMKRTRFEVMKFAMSGYKAQEKQDAKVALAIQLGAIPPKKKYVNYKELMAQRDKEKQEAIDAEKMQALGKKVKKSKQSQFSVGGFRGRGGILGQYGRVSKGMAYKMGKQGKKK